MSSIYEGFHFLFMDGKEIIVQEENPEKVKGVQRMSNEGPQKSKQDGQPGRFSNTEMKAKANA